MSVCFSTRPTGRGQLRFTRAPTFSTDESRWVKVKVVANDEFEALFPKFQPSRVTITTNDGKSHSTRVDVPKGDPRDPMTEEEIAVKFTALGGDVIGKDQCKKLQKFIMSIETAKDFGGLFELTTASA